MILGIAIKNNGIYSYSKPFILNNELKDKFIAQLIRDVDFSILLKNGEMIILDIIIYPNKSSYYEANSKNTSNNLFKKLGSYNLLFESIEDTNFYGFKKGYFKKLLDEEYDLNISFTTIYRSNEDNYIVTTPVIYGNKNYLLL
jgi:hypothetical protein